MKNNRIQAQPFDCMQYFYGSVQEPLIRALAHFNGHINEDILKKAVNLSIGAVPLIGCCFNETIHDWQEHNFIADDIVHIVKVHNDSEKTALKMLLSSINIACEPQLKIFIIRDEDCDTLCVIINHMVSDGGGFKEYLYLLSDLYSKCVSDADYYVRLQPLGGRNLGQLLQNLSLKQKMDILFSKMDSHVADPAVFMPLKGDNSNQFVSIYRIEKEQFDRIIGFAKSSRVSINDMLLTVYIRALNSVTGCMSITIPCPVDLRKYKKAGQNCGICNLTGNYTCHVEMTSDEMFIDTLKKVSKEMSMNKESDACLKGPMLFHLMFYVLPFAAVKKLFYKISPVPVTSYTNLGIIDAAKFRFGSLDIDYAFISTAVKHVPYFQVSISTYNGCCTFTSSLHGTEEDKKTVSDFLTQMGKELENICKLSVYQEVVQLD